MAATHIVLVSLYFALLGFITKFISTKYGKKAGFFITIMNIISISSGIYAIKYLIQQKSYLAIIAIIVMYIIGSSVGRLLMLRIMGYGPHGHNDMYVDRYINIVKKLEQLDIEKIYNPPIRTEQLIQDDPEEKLLNELFECMQHIQSFHGIIEKHNITVELLGRIKHRALLSGVIDNDGKNVPVLLIAFPAPLNYVLSNKEDFFNGGRDKLFEITDNAIKLLY